MDSNPDTGLYSDLQFYDPTLVEQVPPDLVQGTTPDTGFSTDFAPGDISNVAGLLTNLPELLLNLIGQVIQIVQETEAHNPLGWVKDIAAHLGGAANSLDFAKKLSGATKGAESLTTSAGAITAATGAWSWFAQNVSGFLYRGMLESGLGVDTSKFDEDAQAGVNTVDTFLTFSFFMSFFAGAINGIGGGLFGARWKDSIGEALSRLPEEMGITWAEGISIGKAFEIAVGRSIEEGVNRQKRGNRPEWPQTRLMLKQHLFDNLTVDKYGKLTGPLPNVPDNPGNDVFRELLKNQGFPDHYIELFMGLADVQIPVADIAQLWYRDVIDDDKAKQLIAELGFSPEQTGWLYDLYVKKSENEATTEYRSIARQLFQNHLITEDQYRHILAEANYPDKLIDGDITAIKLLQEAGKVLQSVSVIKTRYQHGELNADSAAQALRELNYSPSFITELVHTWDLLPIRKQHGLSQAKILSYYKAGVIKDPKDALAQLMATGLTQDAAQFLLDHPIAGGAKTHKLTPGLITQAYVDGAITEAELSAAFSSTGVTDDALPKYIAVAKYRLAHRKGSPAPVQYPTEAIYREAQKYGIIDFHQAVQRYEQLGYDPDTALMIAEIVNRGPYIELPTAHFATLAEALAYLTDHGYALTPPPDPALPAAEVMAASYGYSFTKTTGGITQIPMLEFIDQNAVISYLVAKGFIVTYPPVP